MKMWSGRFARPVDTYFAEWQRSFSFDRILLPYEIAASKAHAAALAKAGVLDPDELATTLFALDQIDREKLPETDDPAIEDVHHFVETRLVELVGEVGYKLHTGRSRNEQIATSLRLFVRDRIDQQTGLLAELVSAIAEQAENAGINAMPAYTHLQRAEPVLIRHWLLAYCEMFLRDIERLADCRKRANLCPLGSGAVAGTILPLNRHAIAIELGFDGITGNSIDASCDRDFAIEYVQAVSGVGMHLSRWAEDLILYSTTEFGFVILSEQYSTGSSAMPQKKNPDALELIRGKAGSLFADLTSLFIVMKGLPLAYDKDLQETQGPVFSAARQISGILRVAIGVMSTLKFNYDRMQQTASCGFMNAQAAAAYLVRQGVPFRRAHEFIGKAVRLCVEQGCELEQLSNEGYALCGIDADEAFYKALELKQVLDIHDVSGGTAPARVKEALLALKERLSRYAGVANACT